MTLLLDRTVDANGLRHHVVEAHGGARGDLVLLHGYLDLAHSFDAVIEALAGRGFHVVAPDFRGHGDTDRVPRGAYYHSLDYVADLDALADALGIARAHVIAHSMGGSVATRWAAARPERVASLALLEGVGPPAMPADVTPDRTTAWLDWLRKARGRTPRVMATRDEVVARMRLSHPMVQRDVLERAAIVATRGVEGGYAFRFDPLHQTTSPTRFDAEAFEASVARVRCPVLMVDGGDLTLFEELHERARRYPGARFAAVEGAGHMMHWTAPDLLVAALMAFLDDVAPASNG